MFSELVSRADLFFLIAVRIVALVETAPLLSSESIPQAAKMGLAGLAAAAVFPAVAASGYAIPPFGLSYVLLAVGEAMIGLIMGFFLSIVFSAFSTAGELFSLQIGFGASETFDPLAQIEIPLMGQYFNLLAMFVLVASEGFQKLFLIGVGGSFQGLKAIDLVSRREDILQFLFGAMAALLGQSLVIALPILGTLFLVSLGMGLISKAAPQMNLLSEGFPVSLSVAYFILLSTMPFLMEAFGRLIGAAFGDLARLAGAAA